MRQTIGILLILTFTFLTGFTLYKVNDEVKSIESVSDLIDQKIQINNIVLKRNSFIYDRFGNQISEVYGPENRKYVPLEEIPKGVVNTFIAAEDQRFYEHKGFDIRGITRAAVVNAQSNDVKEGGSTITQQLVRNVYLSQDRTYKRKVTELLMSYKLEKKYSKDEIFEFYANAIYFHNRVYGVETASQYYFNKHVNELSYAEAAFLAAIPNNPTLFDPITKYDNTKKRQQSILQKMRKLDFITEEQYNEALNEEIVLNVTEPEVRFPDYVTYIHFEFEQLIAQAEGFDERLKNAKTPQEEEAIKTELKNRVHSLLFEQGVKIETALHPTVQERVTRTINNSTYGGALASMVVIDHQTHQILALSGGKNPKLFEFNNAFQAYRQPGSAIKPLLVYGPYLNEKKVPITTTVNANNFKKGPYSPSNYGKKEYGMVPMIDAFKYSHNTPAVRLLDEIGVPRGFSYVDKFQFKGVKEGHRTDLSTALGSFEVTPLELTSAYTTFGNNGQWTPSRAIIRVTDEAGHPIYEWKDEPVEVWMRSTNDKMREMLAAVVQSGTAKGLGMSGGYIGGKTGTTNNYRDVWFVGLTDRYTAGVWIGGKNKYTSVQSYEQTKLNMWRNVMQPLVAEK